MAKQEIAAVEAAPKRDRIPTTYIVMVGEEVSLFDSKKETIAYLANHPTAQVYRARKLETTARTIVTF